MTEDKDETATWERMKRSVDEAGALVERRVEVERMQQANDARLQRMAQAYKVGIQPSDVAGVRLQLLTDFLLGDMDSSARLEYEHAVQIKFTELIGNLESQVTRSKLLDGVRLDPRQNGGR